MAEPVETFLNLESVVTKEGRTEQGVKITSAWHTHHSCNYFQYGNLCSIFKNKVLPNRKKCESTTVWVHDL